MVALSPCERPALTLVVTMKQFIFTCITLTVMMLPLIAIAEARTYTEIVTVKVEDDEYDALNKAKERAREQALRSYLDDVYKDRAATLNLTGDELYIKDMEVLDSSVSGWFFKELKTKIKVTINEDEVFAYLKHQGVVTGKNDNRRIVVMIIPGKMDSGDAPAVLDNIRAEIRSRLAAGEYTVIDSDDSVVLDTFTEEPDYNKMVQYMSKIADKLSDKGEWLILGKVDMDITPSGSVNIYKTMMTGKLVSLAGRKILWEGNPDGSAHGSKDNAKAALRQSAIAGGKSFAEKVLGALKTITRRGKAVD